MSTAPAEKPAAMKDGIIKRGATYSYVVRVMDPATGKRKPRWVSGFTSVKEAKRARDKARSDSHDGTYVAPHGITVGQWLDQWLQVHGGELKASTAESYRQKIDGYIKPGIGHERLQSLGPMRLSRFFAQLAESGGKDGKPLSPRSVQFTRAILRKALNDAVVERHLSLNPVEGSKTPRVTRSAHVTWTGEQQRVFLDAVGETRWAVVWLLALASGMRRGELCALTWDNVDLDAGIVKVEASTVIVGSTLVTGDTKNHENRQVALDGRTVAALRAWRRQQAAERLQWGPAYHDTGGLVATWEDGTRMHPDYMSKQFKRSQHGLGLPTMNLHGTRHSHATTLLRAGVPVHVVAKRLGHRDPSVTLNVYADAIPQDDAATVDVFSRAVWGVS